MSKAWIDYAIEREAMIGDVEIVALVDIDGASARSRAAESGLSVHCGEDLSAAIRETGANLVFDITIPEAHTTVARTAFSLGCDLMGEKPLSASIVEARETVALALSTGRRYSVMQNRRYLKDMRAYRNLIGQIGRVGIVNVDFYLGPRFGGFRDLMDSPLLLDMAIHTFDQARFLSGADATSVWCKEFNPPWSWYSGAASAVCVFELSNGAVFTYRGSWCAEGLPTSWEGDWRVVGDSGTALWNGADAPRAELRLGEPSGFIAPVVAVEADSQSALPGQHAGQREGHEGCLDEMFAAFSEGRPAETECIDNLKSLEMVFAAVESARSGKTVRI
jgi:predicted dehydrogenase